MVLGPLTTRGTVGQGAAEGTPWNYRFEPLIYNLPRSLRKRNYPMQKNNPECHGSTIYFPPHVFPFRRHFYVTDYVKRNPHNPCHCQIKLN